MRSFDPLAESACRHTQATKMFNPPRMIDLESP